LNTALTQLTVNLLGDWYIEDVLIIWRAEVAKVLMVAVDLLERGQLLTSTPHTNAESPIENQC
jgi:hypothetical protein